jgi:hypothetical protein
MYRIYPTLLNSYIMYAEESTNSSGELLVSYQDLLDKINRVPKPTTEAQQRGISFETALTTGAGEEQFPEKIISQMRNILPPRYKTQFYIQTRVGNITLYGYVDVVGGNQAFDIKTTRKYSPNRFADDAQNLYLLGLKTYGIEQLSYLITDMEEVFVEEYKTSQYNFGPLLERLDNFTYFLENNRSKIRNKKVFDAKPNDNQLSLF